MIQEKSQSQIIAEADKVWESLPPVDISTLVTAVEKARGSDGYADAVYQLKHIDNAANEGTPVSPPILKEHILPLYSEALDSGNQKAINYAISGLWRLGPIAAPLLPKVIKLAEQDDPHSLHFPDKIHAMAYIAPGDPVTLPILLRLFADTNATMIALYNGSKALSHFGPEASAAVPGLHRFIEHVGQLKLEAEVKTDLAFSATFALWRIAKEPPSIALLQAAYNKIADNDVDVTPMRVLELLGGLPNQTAETKSILHQLAQSSNPEVQTNAVALLKKIGAN